jgi:hypothetical protein
VLQNLGMFFWDVILDTSGCIVTFSGSRFCPLNPSPEDIRIEDIGHALAHQCRFGGHTCQFYSIAQHSILVSQLCRPEDALWGLLHDASEAYLQDVVRPLKELAEFEAYRLAERHLQHCIVERFGLGTEQPTSVTAADDWMLAVEARDLMATDGHYCAAPPTQVTVSVTNPWSPERAEREFLATFQRLFESGS